jgi:hypothetical protein
MTEVGVPPAPLIVRFNCTGLDVLPAESVTTNVGVNVPLLVGVPVS